MMFNKERIKGIVMGVTMTILLFTTALAEPVEKTIKVFYNNIKIVVDGKPVVPSDGNGNPIAPFIYNGTTYLPVRAVGEALGKTVNWERETSTVYIGEYDKNKPSIYLDELDTFTVSEKVPGKITSKMKVSQWTTNDSDNTGKIYSRGLKIFHDGGFGWGGASAYQKRTYLLNQKYGKIKGTLVTHESAEDNNGDKNWAYVRIFGDGDLLYTSPEIEGGVLPQDFEVDLEGVISLDIEIKVDEVNFGIVDAALYK